jgi:predicted CXXCH cytochrome family protein
MGRSFYVPRPENAVENYTNGNTFYHRASDRHYTMIERDGKFFQRRHQIGYDGKETNVLEKQIDYVMGSGNHGRTYLHRAAEGRLVELPVSWYSEKGGYWAMSPGYDRPDHQDFRRAIPYGCMFCHNGYPEPRDGARFVQSESIFDGPIPEGIDCQRCHGPGRAHIAAVESGATTLDAVRDAIVNPARLSRERQLEVCMQCHLETTSRPLPNEIVRFDRGPFSYRPGEPLGDFALFFDHAPGTGHDDKFEIAHAAYRFRQSACFEASEMTCTTCHNPHAIPRGQEAVDHYEAVCRGCHDQAHGSGAPVRGSCVDCHMPKRRSEDAVHVVMTDHYIQRRKPPGDLLAARQEIHDEEETTYRGEVALYYPPQLPDSPEKDLYLAVAQVQNSANLEAGIPRLRQAIERHAPQKAEFSFELAKAYGKAGNQEEAIRWYEAALRHDSGFKPAVKGLVSALTAVGQVGQAAIVLEKAAAAPSADAVIFANLGNIYLQQAKLEQAAQMLEKAIALNSDLPEAHNLQGLLFLRQGNHAGAGSSFRAAIRVQPDLAEAHNNLANLLAESRDYKQAQYHFEKAIASNPLYAEGHHRYGLLLLVLQSYDKALTELQEAVRLKPDVPQAHSDLADVLAAAGQIPKAIEEYRLAIQLRPGLYEANYALGSLLLQQGKMADAEEQFQLAIRSNPSYHEAHFALASVLMRKGDAAGARAHYAKAAESPDPGLRQAALSALP